MHEVRHNKKAVVIIIPTSAEKDSDNLGLIGPCCPLTVLQKNTKLVMVASIPILAILLI
jgi:hypothetical protein